MTKTIFHKTLTLLIGFVWLINGLICKVLNFVPRHQEIVSEILGSANASILTKVIGVSEICMAIWIFSGIKSRYNAILQIAIIVTMNILEFSLVPHLLLWGRFNIIFATLMILTIYYNEFVLSKKLDES